jgi:hypothetical protein
MQSGLRSTPALEGGCGPIRQQRLGRFGQVAVELGQVAGSCGVRARLARRIGEGAEDRQDLGAKPVQGGTGPLRAGCGVESTLTG